MKKAIVLLLTGAMALSLAACGGQARTIPGTYKAPASSKQRTMC